MMEWQPIETAPKNRSILLAIWEPNGPYYVLEVGWWEEFGMSAEEPDGFWSSPCTGPNSYMHPTHWMELPQMPMMPYGELE